MKVDEYGIWRQLLRGEKPDYDPRTILLGIWRMRNRAGLEFPVVTRRHDGDETCTAWFGDGRPEREIDHEFVEQMMGYLARRPVSSDAYKHWLQHHAFPDEVSLEAARAKATLKIADGPAEGPQTANASQVQIVHETIRELRQEAQRWWEEIGEEITHQIQADRAANYADRFSELEKEAERTREAEKRPHLEAGRKVDRTWQPVVAAGKEAKAWAKGLLTEFLKRRKAELATQAEGARPRAGTRGRAVGLRTVKQLKTTSAEELFNFYQYDPRFRQHYLVLEALGKLALTDLERGSPVKGAELIEVETAA